MPYDKPDFGDDDFNDFSRFEDEEELGADREETIEEEEAGEEELSVEEHPGYAPPSSLPSAALGRKHKPARKMKQLKPGKKKPAKPAKKAKQRGKAKAKRRS